MSKILVIEDEAGIRSNLRVILKAEGHEVHVAENGRLGLEAVERIRPDLVLCDVMMPEMDGFQLLETLRKIPAHSDLPFIFLTALDDNKSRRRGMNLGADDYLNKPFSRDDLLEAISSRLSKHNTSMQAISERLVPKNADLRNRFREQIAPEGPELEALRATGKIVNATILFSDIRNFTTFSERLTAKQTAELLNAYFERACGAILVQGGRIAKLLGDGVMSIFETSEEYPEVHAARAIRAALDVALAAYNFRDWIREHRSEHGLPEFSVGAGLHTGEVVFARIGPSGPEAWAAIGDTINVASRLESKTKELHWPVIASAATLAAAGEGVDIGEKISVELRGREEQIEIAEVRGIVGYAASGVKGVELPPSVRSALAESSSAAARASKDLLNETLRSITTDLTKVLLSTTGPLAVKGYRILSKIGEGGMSHVYLARRESDSMQVVLKILNARPTDDPELFQRFMGEIAIISEIDHHNVVHIYDHGFTESCAFIAMEYFSRGTLREIMDQGLTPRQALSLLAQLGGAIAEIHRRRVLHRDLKPANVMVREDGSIALADFGIAKKLEQAGGHTKVGEIIGTPYYLPPEIADGGQASIQSDLYSLGIMFYEMLVGRRPFDADTVMGMISQHLRAPVPRLSADLADYQEIIDRMLAKNPADRYASADDLLEAIDRVWTQISLRALSR